MDNVSYYLHKELSNKLHNGLSNGLHAGLRYLQINVLKERSTKTLEHMVSIGPSKDSNHYTFIIRAIG